MEGDPGTESRGTLVQLSMERNRPAATPQLDKTRGTTQPARPPPCSSGLVYTLRTDECDAEGQPTPLAARQ